jgi:meso-butanediol dehydrogenase/(S,S)-butanediol dehydrogenase/diacetyl reductase
VNISSISGRLPDWGNMPYTLFKAAIIQMTQALAVELAADNINVNCICPGFVYTPLWERSAIATYNRVCETIVKGQTLPPRLVNLLPPDFNIEKVTPHEFWNMTVIARQVPMKREQTAEDMGRATVFFVSEDAKNITGQTLCVDGGVVMR